MQTYYDIIPAIRSGNTCGPFPKARQIRIITPKSSAVPGLRIIAPAGMFGLCRPPIYRPELILFNTSYEVLPR